MTHLIQITIGPVQDFIAQARRTRDLWYGSHLLSELSRAVARSLAELGSELVFPALSRSDPDLKPCMAPFRTDAETGEKVSPLAVANIILATVEIDAVDEQKAKAKLEALAKRARSDLQVFWKNLADGIRGDCGGLIATDPKIADVWDEQITSLIEFSAAWSVVAPDKDEPNAYKATRDRLNKAIAGRKNLRDFEPWQYSRAGAPKSSLDGARETVLRDGKTETRDADLVRKYRLGEGEQLDAVGLVKRAGGNDPGDRKRKDLHDLQFVPIVNVALAPWIRCAQQNFCAQFEGVVRAIKSGDKKLSRWPRVLRNIECGSKTFEFDAGLFVRSRWWPEFKEIGEFEPKGFSSEQDKKKRAQLESDWRKEVIDWGDRCVGPVLKCMTEPHPYVACLVADGDGMGKAIDALGSAEEHRGFSRELAKFAGAARDIVEREEHLGSLVYSGGDDVLAFLPVWTALACADELRKKFVEIMNGANLPEAAGKPTLSVGIGIGHVMESMGDLLDLGRRAEKLAKGGHLKFDPSKKDKDRNALAVILDKRSGGTRQCRAQWTEWPQEVEVEGKCERWTGPVARLLADADLLKAKGPLSTRRVYQIAALLRRLPRPDPKQAAAHVAFTPVLIGEVERILRRADGGDGALTMDQVGLLLGNNESYERNYMVLAAWIDRVLIARAFAEAEPRPRSRLDREEENAA